MQPHEYGYLIFVLIAFVAFAITGGIGVATYRIWRNRRGTSRTGAASGADGSTPPSYPKR